MSQSSFRKFKPSNADETLTQKMKQAGNYLELNVIDHLIICGKDGYYSFADEGLLQSFF